MNIYNSVQSIKSWFKKPVTGAVVGNDFGADADLIRELGQCVFLEKSDGASYFYCFPYNAKNKDVLKYLFRRNGINMDYHQSRYLVYKHGPLRFALRVCTTYFTSNPAVLEFAELLTTRGRGVDDINGKITQIRHQMSKLGQKSR